MHFRLTGLHVFDCAPPVRRRRLHQRSRTTLSSNVVAGLRAPVPGHCLGFSVPASSDGSAGAPATAPRDPVLAVRLAGDAVQRASDAQLARALDKVARS